MSLVSLITGRNRTAEKLTERSTFAGASKVDRDKGFIYGVTLLGPVSKNGRRYTESARKKAAQLYEGKPVNFDHADEPGGPRKFLDRGGWIEHAYVDPADGKVKGDIGVLLTSAGGPMLLEIADRKPSLCGFSHDVEGQLEMGRDGIQEVVDITEVTSVDAVDRPATTKTIFESETPTMKLCEFVKTVKNDDPLLPLLQEAVKTHGDAVVEKSSKPQSVLAALLAECKRESAQEGVATKATEAGYATLTEAINKLSGEVKSLVEWKSQLDVERAAHDVLQENHIDERPELLNELKTLGNKKAMQERVALWPDYIREPISRPLIESIEPTTEENHEQSYTYENCIERWTGEKLAAS